MGEDFPSRIGWEQIWSFDTSLNIIKERKLNIKRLIKSLQHGLICELGDFRAFSVQQLDGAGAGGCRFQR